MTKFLSEHKSDDSGLGSESVSMVSVDDTNSICSSTETIGVFEEDKPVRPRNLDPSYYPQLQWMNMINKYNHLAAMEGLRDLNFEKQAGIEFVLKHEEFCMQDVMVFYNNNMDVSASLSIIGDNGYTRQVSPCREFFVLTRLYNQRELNYECKLPFTKDQYNKTRMAWLKAALPLSMRKLNVDQLDHIIQEFDCYWQNPHTIPYKNNTKPSEDAYVGRTKGLVFESIIKYISVNSTKINHEVVIDTPLAGYIPCRPNKLGDGTDYDGQDIIMRDPRDHNNKLRVYSMKIHNMTSEDFEIRINEHNMILGIVDKIKHDSEFLRYYLKNDLYKENKLIDDFRDYFNVTPVAQDLIRLVKKYKEDIVTEVRHDQQVIGLSTGLASNLVTLKKKLEKFRDLKEILSGLNVRLVSSSKRFNYVSEEVIDEYRCNRTLYKNDYDEIMKWFDFYVDHGRMPYTNGSPETDRHIYNCSLALWRPRPSNKKDYNGNKILTPNLTDVLNCMAESINNQIELTKFYGDEHKKLMISRKKDTLNAVKKWHDLMEEIKTIMHSKFDNYVDIMRTKYLKDQVEYAKDHPDEVNEYKQNESPEVERIIKDVWERHPVTQRYYNTGKTEEIIMIEPIEYEHVTYKYDYIPDSGLYPSDQPDQTCKKNRRTKRDK
jgi:hypothetical protein